MYKKMTFVEHHGCLRIGRDNGRNFDWIPFKNILKIRNEIVEITQDGESLYLLKATLLNGETIILGEKIKWSDFIWLLDKIGKGGV